MARWQDRHMVIPAVYVVLEKGSAVLLIRRANTGYRDGFYSLPAGHLDGGESAAVAAVRECAEEVGVIIQPDQLQLVHVMHRLAEEGDHERIDMYFKATKWEGEPSNKEPHKCDDVQWFDFTNLPDTVVPTVREALEAIKVNKSYSENF